MHNILSINQGDLCDLYRQGRSSYNARKSLNVKSSCCTTLLNSLNISLSTDQLDCSIWSRGDAPDLGRIDNNGEFIQQK